MTPYKTSVMVAPTVEPITLDEAKEQLRLDPGFTLDDDLINAYISASRDRAESYCNRYFTQQTILTIFFSSFPSAGKEICIPYSDLTSVNQIQYTDGDNVIQTLNPSEYTVDLDKQVIYPVSSWPTDSKSYRIVMVTGSPVSLPAVKTAISMMVADNYEHRTEIGHVQFYMNPAVQAMLYPYRNNLGIK